MQHVNLNNRRRRRRARGMSLLEIMVVITLIGLVTAAVGVAVMSRLEEGKIKLARDGANNIAAAMEIYKLNNGRYPTTAEGLHVLVQPPKGKPVIDDAEKLKDQWTNEYVYVIPGTKNPTKFDVRSKGPDGQEGTEDDVGNWPEE